jgi:ParB/RepB/Spo0J family partition protein
MSTQPSTTPKPADTTVLPLKRLLESLDNPRKRFGEKEMGELTASIKQKGILVPLLVRPIDESKEGSQYEIVDGARRFRAARKAGLAEAPVRIVKLNDEEAMEIRLIVGLQSDDLHPLEEALGYKRLLETARYDVTQLAEKISKSVSYVYQRLKLAELTPDVQKAFLSEKISAGHAILIARLQPPDQAKTLHECAQRDLSVREVANYIHEEIHLNLNVAPWKLDDAKLLPKAGACTNCPKRTGANPELFPDVKHRDTCTDPGCYQAKMGAHFVQIKTQLEAGGRKVVLIKHRDWEDRNKREPGVYGHGEYQHVHGKPCAHTVTGLVVEAEEYSDVRRGEQLQICIEKKCKEHWGRQDGSGRSAGAHSESQKSEQRKYFAKRAAREDAARQIAEKAKWPLTEAQFCQVANVLGARLDFDSLKAACKLMGWWPKYGKVGGFNFHGQAKTKVAKLDMKGIAKWLLMCVAAPNLRGDTSYWSDDTDELRDLAVKAKINLPALEKKYIAEANAKARKKSKPKAAPKPAAKKTAKKATKKPAKKRARKAAKKAKR